MRTTTIILLLLNWTCLLAQSTSINSWAKKEKLISQLKKQFTISEYDRADIIMPFNKDTILMAGYLSDFTIGNSPKNVVYRTTNGGTTWELIKFKGDAWIYNADFQKDGKIWMGGSDEFVHFSSDYGTSWSLMPKPFKPTDRVLSIYMLDSLNGVAGGLSGKLAITMDNWKTTKQIPTPLNQKKYTTSNKWVEDRIDQIQMSDSILLINQSSHVFFSNINKINWKEFNIPIYRFEINKRNKIIKLLSSKDEEYYIDYRFISQQSAVDSTIMLNDTLKHSNILNLIPFLNSEINLIKITSRSFYPHENSGGKSKVAKYKEIIRNFTVSDKQKINILKNILLTNERFSQLRFGSFTFSQLDLDDYSDFYNKKLQERKKEIALRGDSTLHYEIENKNFSNPNLTLENLSQKMLESLYYFHKYYPSNNDSREPFISIEVINKNSECLKITSEEAVLCGLPWTLEFKGDKVKSYDNRMTEFVKSLLKKGSINYNKLLGGELIYRLIELKVRLEMEFKNGY